MAINSSKCQQPGSNINVCSILEGNAQSGIVIKFDNLDQNKPRANRCSNFRSRDLIWGKAFLNSIWRTMSRCFQKSKGVLPRQKLMCIAFSQNRHLAEDFKTGEIVFETQFSKYANKTSAESLVYFKQIIKLIRSLFLLKCSNYRDTVMEDNGYSVKDRGFIFNIVYRSLLFRSSFCFFPLVTRR